MAELAGINLVDASGNRLTDLSAAYIIDQNIQVVQDGSGYLYNANMAAGGASLWGQIVGWLVANLGPILAGVLVDKLFGDDPNANVNLPAEFAAIGQHQDRWVPTSGLDYQTYMLDLETWLQANWPTSEGGLTVPEHDQLMQLVNADVNDIAAATWSYTQADPTAWGYNNNLGTGTILEYIKRWLDFQAGYVGLPVPDRAHFNLCYPNVWENTVWFGFWTNEAATTAVPELDLSLVESGDTVWTYLIREYPAFDWILSGPGSWPTGNRVRLEIPTQAAYYVCTLTDADIRNWWPPTSDPPPTVNVSADFAPVWPGASSVTYGTPAALVDQAHVVEPMDGVIVSVTTPPTRTGLRQIGGALYDYGVGELAFETDGGDIEPWQYLGFRAAIFTPKTMKRAAGVRFRVLAGAEGTVTPWTKS